MSKGLTQEELGQIIGVKKAAVQKWESGITQNLKRTTIQALADYFNVNPAKFVDGTSGEYQSDLKSNVGFSITDHEKNIIISYRKQPESVQIAIDKMLDVERPVTESQAKKIV